MKKYNFGRELGGYRSNILIKQAWMIVILFLAALIIFLFRGHVFSYNVIYAEDGLYLSNIIRDGFLRSCLQTRSGGTDDFFNLGSYIMLEVAYCLNKLIYGNSIIYLPIFVGVVASVFFSLIAVLGYVVFAQKNALAGVIMWITVVLVPTGVSGGEIWGKVLNTVWLYPLLTEFLLLLSKNQNMVRAKKFFIAVIIMICGLSFPVSFGVLGIWEMVYFLKNAINRNVKGYFILDKAYIIVLVIGLLLLPSMMGSKGATDGLVINESSLIEFVFARHFLYTYTYFFYNHLTDFSVIIIWCTITILSVYIIIKKGNDKAESFAAFFSIYGAIFASAFMRLQMSDFFDNYSSSYPDRYYYGCNLLFNFWVLYMMTIKLDYSKKQWKIFLIIWVLYLGSNKYIVLNETLFENAICGDSVDVRNWSDCIEKSQKNEDIYSIPIFPYVDGKPVLYMDVDYMFDEMSN